jgi:hypothetical protein
MSVEPGWLIGLGSIVVNLFLLILNLRVGTAIAEVKLEVEKLRTDMATQRAEGAERQLKSYQAQMDYLRDNYISRAESERMHQENQRRWK